jgi:hypothetical protein
VRNESLGGQPQAWYSLIDLSLPYWIDYRELIRRLSELTGERPELPGAGNLQRVLPRHAVNQSGQPISFRPSRALPAIEYEGCIFRTGQVSTRENSSHDLFNALVWARFPHLKAALNALHCREIRSKPGRPRGRLRDALTLLDECGVILASANDEALERLSARDWPAVFCDQAACWREDTHVFVCGHALLQKFLKPYKSLTAHALLVRIDAQSAHGSRESLLQMLDAQLAQALLTRDWLKSPDGLSPIPLMGIPGWSPDAAQDRNFYSDRQVFRPPAADFIHAPVFSLVCVGFGGR